MGEMIIDGIPASPGIVIGKLFILKHEELDFSIEKIPHEQAAEEIKRFKVGRETAYKQLQKVYEKALINLTEEEAEVFEGHLEILMDEDLEEEIIERIEGNHFVAEKVIGSVYEENALEMEALDNPYMKERAADVRDIGRRLQYAVAGAELITLDSLDENVIVIATDLSPSDTAQMDKDRILGFATEKGGLTSHVAIMAKSMEIPAIVGAGELLQYVKNGQTIILDASMGSVIISPDEETIQKYKEKIHIFEINSKELAKLKELPAETKDGHRVEMCANIGSDKDIEGVLKHGAEGIGLFRTEFLYMDKPQMPTEEEQYESYKKVAEAMEGKSVIIRTMDIGGDKEICYLDIKKEENPFLGWRAIRMCLDLPDMFAIQLRAILRASHYGKLRIMYPMIISVNEIKQLNTILEAEKIKLRKEGIPFDEKIEVGIMIETPAAAVISHVLIKEVDFFSIGTNDLTQYTLAVDRGNDKIADLYQPLHPAVLILINRVIKASHDAGKWTGMCGELASNERAALVLLGMGLDEFSMSPVSIGKIKNLIRKSNFSDLAKLTEKVLETGVTQEIKNILDEYLLEYK